MKLWQFFLIMSAIYLSKHVSEPVALGLGTLGAIVGCYAMVKDR